MMTDPPPEPVGDEPPVKRGRGRPPSTVRTVPVHFRVSESIYDRYARVAVRAGLPVLQVMKGVLSVHAPRE